MPARAKLSLRTYTPDDFEALYEIDQACYPPDVAYSREELHAYLLFPGADCILACDSKKPVGFCLSAHWDAQGYIVTMDVLDTHRRRGIGSQMLTESERRLAAAGVREVHLETATDTESSVAFWQKHGYRKQGLKKGYYPGGRDAYAMTKPLDLTVLALKERK